MEELKFMKSKYIRSVNLVFLLFWVSFLIFKYASEVVFIVKYFFAQKVVLLFYLRFGFLVIIIISLLTIVILRLIKKNPKNVVIYLPIMLIQFFEALMLLVFRLVYKIYNPVDARNFMLASCYSAILLLSWLIDVINRSTNK